MVILGLGSNIGDKLAHLRQALTALRSLSTLTVEQVSPVYISNALLPDNAPADWDKPHLNCALRCQTSLTPQALLAELKKIELALGRMDHARWSPRVIDIDILAWDALEITTNTLQIPHKQLLDRPFALWPLADVAPFWIYPRQSKTAAQLVEPWGSRFTGEGLLKTRQIYHRIDTPQLVGILNVSTDSFSDGGEFNTPEKALKHARQLAAFGAEVIDVGAESTSPVATALSIEEEWSRLEPILTILLAERGNFFLQPKISLDTRRVEIARKALTMGVDWINDVTGLDDPDMRALIAETQAECIVMHHLSIPERRDHVLPRDLPSVPHIYDWAERRLEELEKSGIARQRIIFDPGIGFGLMAEQSLAVLNHVHHFAGLNTRLLIGHSRKTFMALFTAHPFSQRDPESLAISLALLDQPIHYLRVHNVELTARGFKAVKSLEGRIRECHECLY